MSYLREWFARRQENHLISDEQKPALEAGAAAVKAEPSPQLRPGLVTSELINKRFHLECWLYSHRPDLLAAIRRAEEEVESAWFWAEAGFLEKLAAAEAALAQAVEAGREARQEEPGKAPGPEEEMGREMTFAEVERAFGGFERVWNLTDAQAARLEQVFAEKGPVVVQSPNRRWWSAEEWYKLNARLVFPVAGI